MFPSRLLSPFISTQRINPFHRLSYHTKYSNALYEFPFQFHHSKNKKRSSQQYVTIGNSIQTTTSSLCVSSLLHHPAFSRCCYSNSSIRKEDNKSTGTDTSTAFNRNMKRLQRDSAARIYCHPSNRNESHKDDFVDYDYFQKEIAMRLVDRLDDIKKEEGFPLALDIGAGAGHLHRAICMDDAFTGQGGIGGIRKLVQLDSSHLMLHRDDHITIPDEERERCDTFKLQADEETQLPFPDGTFDLVLSSAALHFVNDLPFLFREVNRVLKPDGCFMFAMVGGATLPELRSSLVLAEMERDGGVSPHVGPFVDFADVGTLITSAGFSLPTVDIDTIHFAFPNAMVLMEHLQRMGEGNVCFNRKERTSLDTFIASAAIYQEMFPLDSQFDDLEHNNNHADQDSTIQASVQVIYAIGWTPHESQQKPLARGSGTHKVGEMVETHKSQT